MQAELRDGNISQDEIKHKSDDFFDEVPAKTPEPSSTEGPTENKPIPNGDVEGHQSPVGSEKGSVGHQNGGEEDQGGQQEVADQPVGSEEQAPTQNGEPATDATPRSAQEVQTDSDKYNEDEEEEEQQQQQQQQQEQPTECGEEEQQQNTDSAPAEAEPQTEAQGESNEVQTLAVSETPQDRASKASSYDDEDFSSSTDAVGATPAPPASAETGENSERLGEQDTETPAPEQGAEATPREGSETPNPAAVATEENKSEEDNRAEDSAVVPVVVEQPEVKTDGRSTPGLEEKEGNRGEDRPEQSPPEGTEDSRGQGQWRPEEQQAMEAAVMIQQSDREQLDQVKDDKQKLQHEYDALKARFESLLLEMDKQSDQIVVGGQVAAEKDKRIGELEEELENLRLSTADAGTVELRVKDLQERLAILARENEEKDRRIFKLEGDLKDTTTKLRDTERKLFAAETTNASGGAEVQKSKTCIVM